MNAFKDSRRDRNNMAFLKIMAALLACFLETTNGVAQVGTNRPCFYYNAESQNPGDPLPQPPFFPSPWQEPGTVHSKRGKVVADPTAPQGTNVFRWDVTGSNTMELYHEVRFDRLPEAGVKDYYYAFFVRFDRKDGKDIWRTWDGGGGEDEDSFDKAFEVIGDGIRWIIHFGNHAVRMRAHRFSVYVSNSSYHLNPGLEVYDGFYPNHGGFSRYNSPELEYEKWHAVVFKMKWATNATGEIGLWINGKKALEHKGIKTAKAPGAFERLQFWGTIAQPAYDAPPHVRKVDAMLFTDQWDDVVRGGYLRDVSRDSARVTDPVQSGIHFFWGSEDQAGGSLLPSGEYDFHTAPASRRGHTATGATPHGTNFMEWRAEDRWNAHYTEVAKRPGFPITNLLGRTFYLAYLFNFTRIDGRDIWHETGDSADKGVELSGPGLRWILSRGHWGSLANNQDHRYTVWLGNPAYHLNPALEVNDIYLPNRSGFSAANPIQLDYDRWHSAVMAIRMATNQTGSIACHINGYPVSEYTNIITLLDATAFIERFTMGGTMAHPAYDAPAHFRRFDALLLTENWQNIVECGYLRDPALPPPPERPRVSIGRSGTNAIALRWPIQNANWILEATHALGSFSDWQAVTTAPVYTEMECTLVYPAPSEVARCVRLRGP